MRLAISSFKSVNTVSRRFTVLGYWRTIWRDPRLAYHAGDGAGCYDTGIDILEHYGDIWHPGVVINNMGEMELVNYDGVVLYLYPDGTVIFTRVAPRPAANNFQATLSRFRAMLSLELTCDMHFGQLPYDTHVCAVNFESYMEPSSEVRLLAQGGAADDPDSGISLDAASELEHTTWIVEGGRDGFASPGRMVRKLSLIHI